MTIADTLYGAANVIRDYLEDDMEPSDRKVDELMDVVRHMDALRAKIDALGIDRLVEVEREFRKDEDHHAFAEATRGNKIGT